jgi:hypothetical protein
MAMFSHGMAAGLCVRCQLGVVVVERGFDAPQQRIALQSKLQGS